MFERNQIRMRLEARFSEHQKQTLIFAATTVLLTPVAILLAIVIIFVALSYIGLDLDDFAFSGNIVSYFSIGLVILSLGFFVGRRGLWKDSVHWVVGGLLVAVGTIFWGIAAQGLPTPFFWIVYGVGYFLALAFLGYAYTPRDHYYLGWLNGTVDNPFTLRDDAHRAHFGLGFATALPKMIFEAYGHLFGSRWLWTQPKGFAFTAAAQVLIDTDLGDAEHLRKTLGNLDSKNLVTVMSLLQGMEMIREGKNGYTLTRGGRKTIGV